MSSTFKVSGGHIQDLPQEVASEEGSLDICRDRAPGPHGTATTVQGPDSPAQEVAATPPQHGGSSVACDVRLPWKRQLIKTLGGPIVCILSPAEKQLFTVCLRIPLRSLGAETQKRLFSGAQFSS